MREKTKETKEGEKKKARGRLLEGRATSSMISKLWLVLHVLV
jgi:hypothetical protein